MSYKSETLLILKDSLSAKSCSEICEELKMKGIGTRYLSGSISSILTKLVKNGFVNIVHGVGPRGGMGYKITEIGKNYII